MTVDDPDAPWHPQFFGTIASESQRLTEDPSDGPWHGDGRSGESREPGLRFSPGAACPCFSLR